MTGADMPNQGELVPDGFPLCFATRSNPSAIPLWLNFMLLPTERLFSRKLARKS